MDLQDRFTVEGAEGIDLDVDLAGLGSRTGAAVIDLLVQTLAVFLASLVSAPFGDAGLAVFLTASFLILFGYPVVAETFGDGQTIGKRALGIAVVRADGAPVTFLSALIRNVLRVIDALPGTYLVGAIAVFASSRNQRLGDMAAGTLVVHRPRAGARIVGGYEAAAGGSAPDPATGWVPGTTVSPVLSPEVVGWDVSAVTTEEVAAVRSFLVRRHQLDPTHRANLAQTLAFQLLPKVAGVPLDGGPEHFLERIAAARTG
jgi:uncharacterized RDD family membrane protein YckC